MTGASDRRRFRLSALGRWLLVLTGIYLAVGVLLAIFQRRLIYVPTREEPPSPAALQVAGIRDVTLEASDGTKLRGWYWSGSRPRTLVMFHGNGGNRYHRLDWMRDMHDLGYGTFVLDYRGYGGSGGSPTEEGLYQDAEAAVAWVEQQDAGALVYYGESLGSAVAIEMAVRRPPSAVIVEGGFTSVLDVARGSYPIFPVGLVLLDRFDSASKVGRISCPLLVIHGARDSIIPPALGRRLHEAAGPRAELWIVPNAGHNDLRDVAGREYLRRIDAFLR